MHSCKININKMSAGVFARFKRPAFWPRELEAYRKWRISLRTYRPFGELRIFPINNK
jgi:hypothetical protein